MPEKISQDKKTSKKYYHAAILITAILSIACHESAAQSTWTTNDDAAHNIVWEEKLWRRISFLSSPICEGRATGSRGGNEAAFWIVRTFREAGLLAFGGSYAQHLYAGQGTVGHNIVGMIPGSKKHPCSSYIIVGAHYDHLGTLRGKLYPGADSNASGTVAVTALAEMFSAMKLLGKAYGTSIIFVAFDANRMNMAGSETFWRMIETGQMADPLTGDVITPDKIRLMVNIDQIGSTLSPTEPGNRDYMIMLGNESLPGQMQGLAAMCNRFYGTDLSLSYTYYGSEEFTRIFRMLSDQKIFIENGIPAILFTSGITLNNNKTSDTPGTLDMEVLRKRILLIFHWIEKLL